MPKSESPNQQPDQKNKPEPKAEAKPAQPTEALPMNAAPAPVRSERGQ
jgi:hypothetical protein